MLEFWTNYKTMMAFVRLFVVLCVCCVVITQELGSYRAAVVEYAPRLTSDRPVERLLENVQEYQNYIQQAAYQNVQIIVFPSHGSTGWQNIDENTIEELSTEVPDPDQYFTPCVDTNANFSKAFIDLSCSAVTHKIYVVVNLIERKYNHSTNKMIYHNTNVVFDKTGGIIARYRKINLSNEGIFVPGESSMIFKTDFGVTFGMIICFDIMFKNPSLEILSDPTVTDIVYSAAWFSELPFLESLSIQHGYATSAGVNLLAAGLDDPELKNGGSGIYLAGGKIAETYISGARASKMIIQDVPKISARKPAPCQMTSEPQQRALGLGIGGGMLPDISSFLTLQEDMSNYTFKSLDLNQQAISETVCSGESKFCCNFKITVTKDPNIQPNYVYKLVAFHGVREAASKTVGIRNCGIVACLSDSNASCGGRHSLPPTGVAFDIFITGSFGTRDAHDQPATLNHDLKPITEYTFCKQTANDEVRITMATTKSQSSVLTFGIHGRVYRNDDKPSGPISTATFSNVNIYFVFIVSIIVFLLQD